MLGRFDAPSHYRALVIVLWEKFFFSEACFFHVIFFHAKLSSEKDRQTRLNNIQLKPFQFGCDQKLLKN